MDNANLIAPSRAMPKKGLKLLLLEFDRRGLKYHEVVDPTQSFECVGLQLDLKLGACRHRPARAWRLYLALEHLIAVGGTTGLALRIVVGHLVRYYMIARCALAVLDLMYVFVFEHGPSFGWFSPALLREISEAKGTIFMIELNLAASWSPLAFASDASMVLRSPSRSSGRPAATENAGVSGGTTSAMRWASTTPFRPPSSSIGARLC